MDVNDNAPFVDERVVWTFFASRLAPTVDCGYLKKSGRL
jgi:hypothetical protein